MVNWEEGAWGTQQAQQEGAARLAVGSVWVFLGRTLTLILIIKEGALALERVADHLASSRFPSCIFRVLGFNGQAALHFFASRPPTLAEWIVAQAQQQQQAAWGTVQMSVGAPRVVIHAI